MAGHAIEKVNLKGRVVPVVAAAALIFTAIGSPLLAHYHFVTHPPKIPGDLIGAIAAIQSDGANLPCPITVLTDGRSARALPGLAGFRVFCGRSGLTDGWTEKSALLEIIGFGRSNQSDPPATKGSPPHQAAETLISQIEANEFDYLLGNQDHDLTIALAGQEPDSIFNGRDYLALRIDQQIRALLLDRLRNIDWKDDAHQTTNR